MFTLRKPGDKTIQNYSAAQASLPFSYAMVGCTANSDCAAPRGWNVDRCRARLGAGEEVFERASGAIRQWGMFPQEVAKVCWPDCPIEVGASVAILYHARPAFCWIVFPARIVYVIDDEIETPAGRVRRFGFAYGTLPDHPESGEERFLVEWNRSDGSVSYDLLAVSRPAHWLARVGYPYTRWEQARFRRLSARAMQQVTSTKAIR